MKRPLFPLAMAFMAGLAGGELFLYFPLTTSLSLLLCLCGCFFARYRQKSLLTPQLPLTSLLGFLLFSVTALPSPHDLSRHIGEDVQLIARVDDPVRHYPDRITLTLTAVKILTENGEERVTGRLRLTIRDPDVEVSQGDLLRLLVELREPRGLLNPGGYPYRQSLEREGIRVVASVENPDNVIRIGTARTPLLRLFPRWRERIRKAIVTSLSPPSSAILAAMIIGESGSLTPEIRDPFTLSGTAHILSISGSHLGLVAVVSFGILRWLLLLLPERILLRLTLYMTPSQAAALFTFPPVTFYSLLSGTGVATVRSLIMISVYLLALLIERERDLLNAWALAVLLTLAREPQALFDISFQLSYIAVLAIALVRERWNDSLPSPEKRERPSLREKGMLLFLMTCAASLWTAPLVAYYFNQFTWVGLLSNLLIIPYAGLLILPLGLSSSIASLWIGFLPFASLLDLLLSFFFRVTLFFSSLPFAEIHLPSPSLFLILLFYLLVGWGFREKVSLRARIGLCCVAISLLWIGPLSLRREGVVITHLDVGQGDSSIVEFPDGTTMVIDGGGAFGDFDMGRAAVAPYLWDKGIRRIDYLVLSHPQQDHIGGLPYLLTQFPVMEVWTTGEATREISASRKLRSLIREKKIPVKQISRHSEGSPLETIGDCDVLPLHPPADVSSPPPQTSRADNNRSLVLKIRCGGRSILFTGDIEEEAEEDLMMWGELLHSTLLKVPHHGSRGALNQRFLSAVSPEIAVISAGARNPYGHPHRETLKRYEELGSRIYRTDRDGAITIRIAGEDLSVKTYWDLTLQKVGIDKEIFSKEMQNFRRLFSPP